MFWNFTKYCEICVTKYLIFHLECLNVWNFGSLYHAMNKLLWIHVCLSENKSSCKSLYFKTGGLQQIVLPGINSTSNIIKQEAFHLLGSAVQSNPKVQIAAVEAGLVESLIRAVAYETQVSFIWQNSIVISHKIKGRERCHSFHGEGGCSSLRIPSLSKGITSLLRVYLFLQMPPLCR